MLKIIRQIKGSQLNSFGWLIFFHLLFFGTPSAIQAQKNDVIKSREFVQAAQKAYQEKNYTAYLEHLAEAVKLRPNHPTLIYKYAGALALNGKTKEALHFLNLVLDMGFIYEPAKDESFTSIKNTDEFQEILKKAEKNKTVISNGTAAFRLPEKDLVTEGIAYDPKEETFYISSIHKRKIISLNHKGICQDFVSTEQDGLWGVFGMKVDPVRRLLWVTSSAIPEMVGFQKADDGKAGVFKYDLKSRKLIKKYLLPNQPNQHIFGDLTLNSRGEVWVSDSAESSLYRINPERDELEMWLEPGTFISLQGLTFTPDEKNLLVADYSLGLWNIDLATKKLTKLAHPETLCLLGIDGLYWYHRSLIAVQNGTEPNRLIHLYLNQNLTSIEKMEVLEVNSQLMTEPTLGVLVKDLFYFIGNSQWGSFDQEGKMYPLEKLQEPVILKAKLKP